MYNKFKHLLHYRPFSWLALIARHERDKREEQRRYDAWLKTDDFKVHLRVKKWDEDLGDQRYRYSYPLDEHSVVFDVGGYKGEFATGIFCRYASTIHVFEPMPEFFDVLKTQFAHNPRVHLHRFGLADKSGTAKISNSDISSSIYIEDEHAQTIELKSIVEFVQEQGIEKVDLIKINIEGAEYGLLEALLDAGMIEKFKNIQVQFHDFIVPDARARMEKIQQRLSATHSLTWQYEFVWENWELSKRE